MSPPEAEVEVDVALVRRLLESQHPDLAALPIEITAEGWDNVLARLGDDLVVRLPRRSMGAALIEVEHTWLPRIASSLPLDVPVPLRTGAPDDGYPWSWSICRWLPGADAATTPPDDLGVAAEALGAFVAAMGSLDPTGAPANPYRGVPLAARDEITRTRIDAIAERIDAARVRACWAEHVALPDHSGAPVLLHADLHPANLLVRDGRLVAVLDFGDLTAGDPATDLTGGWFLLPAAHHERFRAALGGVDDATWLRGRGWALTIAVAILSDGADDPRLAPIAQRTLEAILADA